MQPGLSAFPCVCLASEMKEARSSPGAPPFLPAQRASVEVALELDVPLARRTRLTFQARLTESGQVELVEEVLLVGQVGGTERHAPGVFRAGPLDARIQQLVTLRALVRFARVDQGHRHIGAVLRADLGLAVEVESWRDRAAVAD